MRSFESLSEREILAVAIGLEEEDARIYGDFAEGLRATYPATADLFENMRVQEVEHRNRLFEVYRARFGEHIPLIRREDVKGFIRRRPIWLHRPLGIDAVRKQAEVMEAETRRFYLTAVKKVADIGIRQLLNDLADEELHHERRAQELEKTKLTADAREQENEAQHRLFVLQVIQPGLAGLMDGSVSTLAPVFAAAFATGRSWDAFLVGVAASIGAGISMGFAEALSDDGSLTGRGHPLLRGLICGLMTALGGIGHTLPYLIHDFAYATVVAIVVVVLELAAISWIRYRYMDTPLLNASLQVAVGGALVFAAGILIGSA